MKILLVKSGKFSFDPINGPVFDCLDGVIVDLPDNYANQLLDAKWAEKLETIRDKEKPPWKRKDWNPDADDAKQQLIDYCIEVFEVSLDKRRAVSTLIRDIRKLIKEND